MPHWASLIQVNHLIRRMIHNIVKRRMLYHSRVLMDALDTVERLRFVTVQGWVLK